MSPYYLCHYLLDEDEKKLMGALIVISTVPPTWQPETPVFLSVGWFLESEAQCPAQMRTSEGCPYRHPIAIHAIRRDE